MGKVKPDPIRIKTLKATWIPILNLRREGSCTCQFKRNCGEEFYAELLSRDGGDWKQARINFLVGRTELSKERVERALQQGIAIWIALVQFLS